MKKLAGKIHDSELEVMRVLWEAGHEMPLIEIRRILAERCGWEDSTVKTILRRLQDKGIVRLARRGFYTAIVAEDEYSEWSTQAFINKMYNGSAKQLIASLVTGGKLDDADIEELREMFKVGDDNE